MIHTMKDSRPFGLSFMVLTAQSWMNLALNESIKMARKRKLKAPHSQKIYVDDTFGILNKKSKKVLTLSS